VLLLKHRQRGRLAHFDERGDITQASREGIKAVPHRTIPERHVLANKRSGELAQRQEKQLRHLIVEELYKLQDRCTVGGYEKHGDESLRFRDATVEKALQRSNKIAEPTGQPLLLSQHLEPSCVDGAGMVEKQIRLAAELHM
jgi:hypothetical protein